VQARRPASAGVVDEDVEVARLLDEPRGVGRLGNVGLYGTPVDLLRQRLGLLAAAAVADDDRSSRGRSSTATRVRFRARHR
jgi:hypothetical protein